MFLRVLACYWRRRFGGVPLGWDGVPFCSGSGDCSSSLASKFDRNQVAEKTLID